MNILVTGANGQLGNEIQIVLRQAQDKSRQTADTYFFTDVCEGYEHLDITDLQTVREYVSRNGIGAIVNCAAWTNVDGAEDPAMYDLVETLNAKAPENLAIAMKEVGGLLVHISTDYVFGKEPYNTPCREDRTGTPTGVYGLTKLHGEQAIMKVMGDGIEVKSDNPWVMSKSAAQDPQPTTHNGGAYIIIRTAWLYSEFGKNFCKTMLNLTATKPELKVVFDQVGTPTYALDLAKAILVILEDYTRQTALSSRLAELDSASCRLTPESHYASSGIYHFSNEGVCSWYDFTKMIQSIAAGIELSSADESIRLAGQRRLACNVLPCHSSEFPSPVIRPVFSVLDKTKIKETFGVEVPYWMDSLKKCIKNVKES